MVKSKEIFLGKKHQKKTHFVFFLAVTVLIYVYKMRNENDKYYIQIFLEEGSIEK